MKEEKRQKILARVQQEAGWNRERAAATVANPPGKKAASQLGGVCDRCGGTEFKPVRSFGRKATLGFASLLLSANEVQCVMCGAKFRRA